MIRKAAFFASIVMVATTPLLADNVEGYDDLLCSAMQAFECDRVEEGGCLAQPPEAVNMPLFMEIEIDEKVLHTTDISDEQRATEIRSANRTNGLLTLQGDELGRAFSIVIDEKRGSFVMSVTASDEVVVVYGACTADPEQD